MAYANAADPLICVISDFWSFGRRCRGVRPGRKRRRLQVVRGFSMTYFHNLQASWGGLEAYFCVLEAFCRFLAWLGDGLKPCVASQRILRRLGGGSEVFWRRLEGVLEASSRCFGGGLGLPEILFLGLRRDIGSSSLSYRCSAIFKY